MLWATCLFFGNLLVPVHHCIIYSLNISHFQQLGSQQKSIVNQPYMNLLYKFASINSIFPQKHQKGALNLGNLSWNLGNLLCLFRYYNNAYYAKVGGISTAEINFLEVDFLFGLGFHLNVTPNTFHSYYSYLQRQMLLLQPPVSSASAKSELTLTARALKPHFCFDEDEASHKKQPLAAVWTSFWPKFGFKIWRLWANSSAHLEQNPGF